MASTDKAMVGVEAGRTRRAIPRAVLLLALLAGLAAASGARLGAAPTATPRLDWLFEGTPTSAARVGNLLYVGGDFSLAAPSSGRLGALATFSTVTGDATGSMPPLDGSVLALEPDGAGGYFVAGRFTNAGGSGVAHIRADGTVDPVFVPRIETLFSPKLALAGPSLIVGDGGKAPRALDPVTGATVPWVPALPSTNAGAIVAGGGRVFVLTDTSGDRRVTAFDAATGGALWTSAVLGVRAVTFGAPSGAMTVAGSRLLVATSKLYALDVATGDIDPSWGGAVQDAPSTAVITMRVSGAALYLGGAFSAFQGQPRQNLAAADLATGQLLPWNPGSPRTVFALAAAADGTLFVGADSSGGGVGVRALTRIDATGAVTAWTAHADIDQAFALAISPAGQLVVGAGSDMLTNVTAVENLTVLDLASGAMVPGAPVVTRAQNAPVVSSLVSHGTTVFFAGVFDAVNGQPRQNVAAVDATTGQLVPWPAAGTGAFSDLRFASGSWIYVEGGVPRFRRIDATTGVLDPLWGFSGKQLDLRSDGALIGFRDVDLYDTAVGTVDSISGAFAERSRFTPTSRDVSARAIDGDTLYFVDPPYDPYIRPTTTLRAVDLNTGRAVQVPAVTGTVAGVVVGDGRLFARGGAFTVGGTPRTGLVEIARPGVLSGWQLPQADLTGTFSIFNGRAFVTGGLLVSVNTDGNRGRLRVFDLNGQTGPSGLRTQTLGANTVFTWDGPATPPPGGYVIEGGFAAGQTAGALPVGNATSVALPMPAGPAFIRVRAQGSTEVSNEIVAGCFASPQPPTALTTTLNGTALTLSWTAPAGAVTNYTLLAGTASGLSDAATVSLGPVTSVGGQVPGGTFFARVTASNACGTSGPSGEVFFTIGATDPLPAAPTNLTSSVTGTTLTLSWTAPAGPVTGYVLEAGSAPGLANIGAAAIGPGTSLVIPGVPPGVYYVRARAITSAGSGPASSEVAVVLP